MKSLAGTTSVGLALSALTLVLAASCSGGSDGAGPPLPDAGNSLCQEACAVAVVPGCNQNSSCFCADETAPQGACHVEAEGKWECVRTKATFKCENGDVKLDQGCEQEQLAYARCLLCQPNPSDGPCPACETKNCCEEYGELIAVPSFKDIKADCIEPCSDADCVEACYRSDPILEAAYDKARSCQKNNCGSECGL